MATTRVRTTHVYPYTSGANVNIGTVGAGNLLVAYVSGRAFTAVAFANGGTWSAFAVQDMASSSGGPGGSACIGYCLAATGGATANVTATFTGGSDFGITVVEYLNSGATWAVDATLSVGSWNNQPASTTTTPSSATYSVANGSVVGMYFADEDTAPTTHTPTAGFSEFNFDGSHYNIGADELDVGALSGVTSGWTLGTSTQSWGIYVVAFTAPAASGDPPPPCDLMHQRGWVPLLMQ